MGCPNTASIRKFFLKPLDCRMSANNVSQTLISFPYDDLFDWYRPDGGCVAYPRFKGRHGVEIFCKDLLEKNGVLFLPASIYRSELMDTPNDRFRIGFGKVNINEGLNALRDYIDSNYTSLIS